MSGVEISLAPVFLSACREALDGGPRTQALGLKLLLEDGGCDEFRVEDSPAHRSCQHPHPCWVSASAAGPRGPEPLPGLGACGSQP